MSRLPGVFVSNEEMEEINRLRTVLEDAPYDPKEFKKIKKLNEKRAKKEKNKSKGKEKSKNKNKSNETAKPEAPSETPQLTAEERLRNAIDANTGHLTHWARIKRVWLKIRKFFKPFYRYCLNCLNGRDAAYNKLQLESH
jgi:hypothetical protein